MFIRHDLIAFNKVLSSKNNNLHNFFQFSNETCITFENNLLTFMELHIFCLNDQTVENPIIFNDSVQQVLSFGKKYVALLTNSSVLIYDISFKPPKILQKLATPHPKQIALGSFKHYKFLAVLNGGQSNALNYGFVEIYRSVNSSVFTLFQSLKCLKPLSIKFSYIEKSNDFLIHMLTDSSIKPYIIYQYKGVMGFREILSDSILPANLIGFNILNLYSSKQYLVALNSHNKSTLLELAISQN